MNNLKKITGFILIAFILGVILIVFLFKLAFDKISDFILSEYGPTNSIVNITPDGVSFSDYIKISDKGIEIGGSRVDFSIIGDKISDSLDAVGIEVSNNMSGSLDAIDVTEAGFRQNRHSFSSEINRALDIDVKNCDVIIVSGDSSSIIVDVFESDEFTYKINTVDNTLVIRDDMKDSSEKVINILGLKISLGPTKKQKTYTGLAMIIYLPSTFDGQIKLKTTNGDIKLGNMSLSESLTAVTVDGNIEFSNIDSYEVLASTSNGRILLDNVSATEIKANTSNARVSLNNLTAKRLEATTSNASIDFTHLFGEKFLFETSGGDISGSILGQEKLFSINTVSDRSAYPKSTQNDRAQYKLTAKTTGGDINIRFVE